MPRVLHPSRHRRSHLPASLLLGLVFLLESPARAESSLRQLTLLSLEDLTNVEVTSVSRRNEKLIDAAAAVQVLTGERIIRSGATTLQDALRLGAGMQVSQFNGREWAISARGFASVAAEKMEVSLDGRSLYGPLFSGVFWDVQGVMFEDLDRIELIRGPGAALWGANAVNGVINIVTKPASETQGALAQSVVGTRERQGVLRYGGSTPGGGFYRLSAQAWHADDLQLATGGGAGDDRRLLRLRGRYDLATAENNLTVQGGLYRGLIDQLTVPQSTVQGGHVLGRLERPLQGQNRLRVQASYEHSERDIPRTYSEIRNTVEVMAETELNGSRYEATVGARTRLSADQIGSGPTLGFVPARRTIRLYSLYGQARYTLPDPRWKATVGSTLEHNTFTGFEVQPTARLSYSSRRKWMTWLGVSRAVRTPSRIDTDILVPGPAGLTILTGSPDFRSEHLDALETGWRWSHEESVVVELNAFANRYRRLRSLEPAGGTVLFINRNLLKADVNGVESTVTFKPWRPARFILGARWLDKAMALEPESRSPNPGTYQGNDARRIFTLHASFDLPRAVQLDVVLRHVSELPRPVVPAYTEGDVRFAWRVTPTLECALTGRNLFDASHLEGVQSTPAEEISRQGMLTITWRH